MFEITDETRTRNQIRDLIVEKGPVTASALARILKLTSAAIRRHLLSLQAEGVIAEHEVLLQGKRHRGRPARHYVATERALEQMPKEYSDLATRALAYLRQVGGDDAVGAFAATRGREVERRYAGIIAHAGPSPAARARALADALTADGYAASVREIGTNNFSVQLCQGNCPIQAVAGEFPQMCEAETAAFGRLLGVHVQRLATLAGGEHVCTTHIPITAVTKTRTAQSATVKRNAKGRELMTAGQEEKTAESRPLSDDEIISSIGAYSYGWHDSDTAGEQARRGLNETVVRDISGRKNEPAWMLQRRLKALQLFDRKPMPSWGGDLSEIDFDQIKYYVRSTENVATSWEDLPADIKLTYDRLGIPEAERKRLVAGVAAQYESEVVYHQIQEDLERQGVIFLDTDTGLKEHPELFQEYFGSVIPAGDNKFAALNTAVWSGGSFIYVPKGVHVDIPLQAYFRINTENMGQFERTLIIADEGSYVHYVEGCTAPIYKSDSLHAAVVEIVVKKDARVRYTTIQNWSNNVYNLVTKRTTVEAGGTMEWVDGNIGSKVTMKYPAVYLLGEGARGETLSIAFAGEGQHQDTGSKMVHLAPNTSSSIISKSVARGGGRASYRGLVQVHENARHSKSNVLCDALLVDTISRSDTYPYVDVRTDDVEMGHEATVSKVSENQLFYLMSRGMEETEAMAMIVRGFIEPIARELPMEYALELNRLIELQMEGSVG